MDYFVDQTEVRLANLFAFLLVFWRGRGLAPTASASNGSFPTVEHRPTRKKRGREKKNSKTERKKKLGPFPKHFLVNKAKLRLPSYANDSYEPPRDSEQAVFEPDETQRKSVLQLNQ